ncbi:MAG: molybdopterin-guanine dinucleotide biosynthesis protein B [Chloroflexota bacterium]
MSIPVICIIGASGSGKTTLLEKLIPEFKRRGYRLATVKHHSHAGFDIDHPGKDSYRHAQAGSDHVVIASPDRIASYRQVQQEPTLDEIVSGIRDVDLILVEGYKQAGKPSIEIVRGDMGVRPLGTAGQVFAIASNVALTAPVPVVNLTDIQGLADVIEGHIRS